MIDNKGGDVNGRVILLYSETEEPHIAAPHIADILQKHGIIAIACSNPNNFRFVVPEIVPATQVDLIGRLALQSLGNSQPVWAFGEALRKSLAPTIPPT